MSKAKKATIDQQKRSVKDRCPYQSLPYQLSRKCKIIQERHRAYPRNYRLNTWVKELD